MPTMVSASIWMKVALVCLLLGTLLFIIGFSTVAWVTARHNYNSYDAWGLWNRERCNGMSCAYGSLNAWWNLRDHRDYLRAAQCLECIGLIFDIISLITLFIYLFGESFRRRNTLIAVICFIFVAVFFIVVGIAVYGIKMDNYGYNVGWSMGIAIVGAIFMFISGIMCIMQLVGR